VCSAHIDLHFTPMCIMSCSLARLPFDGWAHHRTHKKSFSSLPLSLLYLCYYYIFISISVFFFFFVCRLSSLASPLSLRYRWELMHLMNFFRDKTSLISHFFVNLLSGDRNKRAKFGSVDGEIQMKPPVLQ
jgi:hypothetical protein